MIKTEYYKTRSDGTVLYLTYSDEKKFIERDGVLYYEAVDPVLLEREYLETEINIPEQTLSDEEIINNDITI